MNFTSLSDNSSSLSKGLCVSEMFSVAYFLANWAFIVVFAFVFARGVESLGVAVVLLFNDQHLAIRQVETKKGKNPMNQFRNEGSALSKVSLPYPVLKSTVLV